MVSLFATRQSWCGLTIRPATTTGLAVYRLLTVTPRSRNGGTPRCLESMVRRPGRRRAVLWATARVARYEPALHRAVCGGELRGHSRRTDRKRAVRAHQGQLHQRARNQDRQVSEGRWRDDFPG